MWKVEVDTRKCPLGLCNILNHKRLHSPTPVELAVSSERVIMTFVSRSTRDGQPAVFIELAIAGVRRVAYYIHLS